MSTMPHAGWYPDPADDANIRFWDGSTWTDRTRPKAAPPPPIAQPAWVATPPTPYVQAAPTAQLSPYGPMPSVSAAGVGRIGPDGQPLAGWWRRAGGYLIDWLIAVIAALLTASVASAVILGMGGELFDEARMAQLNDALLAGTAPTLSEFLQALAPGFWTMLAITVAVWLIISLVNGVYLISVNGRTLGDRVVGTRKVMRGRMVPTFGIALARWAIPNVLFQIIPVAVIGAVLLLGDYLWPLGDRQSQTLHDKMTGTYVERADLAGPPMRRR